MKRTTAAIQIITLFVAPLLLIVTGVIPVSYRFFVLGAVLVIVIGIIVRERWSWRTLGMRTDNIRHGLLPYGIFTAVVVGVIVLLAQLLDQPTSRVIGNPHFQYGFLLISFAQEFLYRSFLMPMLQRVFASPLLVIGTNALLFGFLHIIVPNPLLIFSLSFLLGLGLATLYQYRPNLWLITASHAIFNLIAVYFCFANLSGGCF